MILLLNQLNLNSLLIVLGDFPADMFEISVSAWIDKHERMMGQLM